MGAATNKSGECGGEGSGEKGSGGGCGKGGGDAASSSAGGRRSGSWGGSSSLDREFHVILKAGVDVFKHCCEFVQSLLDFNTVSSDRTYSQFRTI